MPYQPLASMSIFRALYLKQMTEEQLKDLHNKEIERGLKEAKAIDEKLTIPLDCFYSEVEIQREYNLEEENMKMKDEEKEERHKIMCEVMPHWTYEVGGDYKTAQDYIHEWDFAIFHSLKWSEYEGKSNSSLLSKVKEKQDWTQKY